MNQRLRETRDVFSPLPATGPEVGIIAERYEELTNHEAVVCTGTDASDHRLKHLPKPPRVLHLATHGFFLEKRSGRTDRPMTLSGLALAGANRGIMGETGPDGEDGILYALEAQNLNLEGTELVVLSACDTGKGEVDVSEGVYGLTRALRTAGARNILMTLWPLNDELAEEFMLNFYENWLSEPPTGGSLRGAPATALHATRLAWINSKDKEKRDPYYWAPYVLVE
uniref:CHAT domain-containing protein n=1 Tax=Candidatus Kentrum sp. UNK TaxID=2126344 RepID=A0A451B1C3_9GAMM|nr:MAG: CHAT domain-containing protein [Candidatus Kentron sp. UNK]VFK72093.1 MAG: CHAT domain-containing protein [Candidatus Kentron sp. UNK]